MNNMHDRGIMSAGELIRFSRPGFKLVYISGDTETHRHYPNGLVYSNGHTIRGDKRRLDSVKSFPNKWNIWEYKKIQKGEHGERNH